MATGTPCCLTYEAGFRVLPSGGETTHNVSIVTDTVQNVTAKIGAAWTKRAAARLPLFGQRACLSTRIVRQGLVVILEGNDGTRLRTGPGDVHRSFEVAYSIAELLCRLRRHCSGACVSDLSAIACQCSDPVFAEISPHKSSCGGVMKEKPTKSA